MHKSEKISCKNRSFDKHRLSISKACSVNAKILQQIKPGAPAAPTCNVRTCSCRLTADVIVKVWEQLPLGACCYDDLCCSAKHSYYLSFVSYNRDGTQVILNLLICPLIFHQKPLSATGSSFLAVWKNCLPHLSPPSPVIFTLPSPLHT